MARIAHEGYSGTNSGGVVIENSEFDENRDGFDTNSQNNDDSPSPQTGVCPGGAVNPHPPANIQRIHSCWVFENNYVHDNNNPNVPASRDRLQHPHRRWPTSREALRHRHPQPVREQRRMGCLSPPLSGHGDAPERRGRACQGGTYVPAPGNETCYYDDFGNEVANNTFTHDGFFGNPTNGDIADVSGGSPNSSPDSNCFHDNIDTSGTAYQPTCKRRELQPLRSDLHGRAARQSGVRPVRVRSREL